MSSQHGSSEVKSTLQFALDKQWITTTVENLILFEIVGGAQVWRQMLAPPMRGQPNFRANPSLASLMSDLQHYKALAWARTSRRSMNSKQCAYYSFCEVYDTPPMPANPQQLGLYAAWLVASGRLTSIMSICQYLSAVRTIHKENNLDCATPKASYELDCYIKGIARQLSRPPKRMSPITPAILNHLLDFPDTS